MVTRSYCDEVLCARCKPVLVFTDVKGGFSIWWEFSFLLQFCLQLQCQILLKTLHGNISYMVLTSERSIRYLAIAAKTSIHEPVSSAFGLQNLHTRVLPQPPEWHHTSTLCGSDKTVKYLKNSPAVWNPRKRKKPYQHCPDNTTLPLESENNG